MSGVPATTAEIDPPSPAASSVDASMRSDVVSTAVLKAAPQVFSLERITSGMAAIVYEYIRRSSLFKIEGFGSMSEYAERGLGVKGAESQKAYQRAGKAAWACFPATAQRVLESVTKGVTRVTIAGAPPSLPRVSVLRELPGALRRTDPAEHAALLQRVEAGEVTHQELRSTGRSTPNAPKASAPPGHSVVADDDGGADGDNIDKTEEASETGGVSLARPDIFNDTPDLEEADRYIGEAAALLTRLVGAWAENPGPDVDPVRPSVQKLVDELKGIAAALENNVIPTTVCRPCHGKGCKRCAGTGWLPKSGAHPKAPKVSTSGKKGVLKPIALRRSRRTKPANDGDRGEEQPATTPVKATTSKKNTTRKSKKPTGRRR